MTNHQADHATALPAAPAARALDDWFAADVADPLPLADAASTGVAGSGDAPGRPPGGVVDDVLDRDEALLASAPSNVSPDELDVALASPPPSARALRLTKVLGVGLVVALAFVGGIALGQRTGRSEVSAGGVARSIRGSGQGFPSGLPSGTSGGQGAPGAPEGQAAAGQDGSSGTAESSTTTAASGTDNAASGTDNAASGTTTGTVKLVDGSVIYLADADGNLTRVEVAKDADITASSKAQLDDISTGDTVTVTGRTTADGLAASSVAVAP